MALNALPATWVRSQGIQMRAFCGMGVMFALGGGIATVFPLVINSRHVMYGGRCSI